MLLPLPLPARLLPLCWLLLLLHAGRLLLVLKARPLKAEMWLLLSLLLLPLQAVLLLLLILLLIWRRYRRYCGSR